MKTVKIHLLSTSNEIIYDNILNSYIKANMYCILIEKDGKKVVHKYPFDNIFRVEETY
jgi:hypothetical protein